MHYMLKNSKIFRASKRLVGEPKANCLRYLRLFWTRGRSFRNSRVDILSQSSQVVRYLGLHIVTME